MKCISYIRGLFIEIKVNIIYLHGKHTLGSLKAVFLSPHLHINNILSILPPAPVSLYGKNRLQGRLSNYIKAFGH